MKLLFKQGIDSKTSVELKELLSFIDIDIKFDKMKSDLITATRKLIELIGNDIYQLAVNAYVSKDEDKKDLVYYISYPIAIDAYRMFAPNNDIAHTVNGRKMRADENQKMPFEWMIDRSNESLERKYYRALDDLLHYLEDSVEEWKNTEAYKKLQQSIFKTTSEFDEHFSIDSRLLLIKLQPGIKQCLRNEIKVRIGESLLHQLLTETIPADQEELYYQLQQACVYYSLAWAMSRLSIQLFPQGIIQSYVSERNTTQSKQVPNGTALAFAKEYFESDFKKAIDKIEIILKASEPVDESDFKDDFITGCNFIST